MGVGAGIGREVGAGLGAAVGFCVGDEVGMALGVAQHPQLFWPHEPGWKWPPLAAHEALVA